MQECKSACFTRFSRFLKNSLSSVLESNEANRGHSRQHIRKTIDFMTSCHDAQVVGPYRVSNPLHLTVLTAESEDYTPATARRKNLLALACLFTFYACLFILCACLFTFFLGANHKALTFHVTLLWICS